MIKHRIVIEGVDKTGKDLLAKYIVYLSNHKYVLQVRGILTQISYSEIYNRPYEYDLDIYKNDVIVYLTGDIDDLWLRHKITNEPKIDLEKDIKVFNKNLELLKNKDIKVLELDTSHHTPYENAKKVIEFMEGLENEN